MYPLRYSHSFFYNLRVTQSVHRGCLFYNLVAYAQEVSRLWELNLGMRFPPKFSAPPVAKLYVGSENVSEVTDLSITILSLR